MDPEQRLEIWQAWYEWARLEFGDDGLVAYTAALAAIRELDAAADSGRAAAVARGVAGLVATALEQSPESGSELSHVEYVLADLKKVDRSRVPAGALDTLTRRYERRRQTLSQAAAGAATTGASAGATAATFGEATAAAGVGQPAAEPGQAAPAPAAAGAISSRGAAAWFDEQGILVLSYIGAFLLIVATLLFEIYGLRGMSGTLQFLAVLALNLAFGGLGWLCLNNRRLRVVGTTYIAIFALMSPLVVLAAYQFLLLRQHGVSPEEALFFGATYCTLLYGLLAARLGSLAHAWLSLVALPFAAWGLATWIGYGQWSAPALAAVCILYLAVSFVPATGRAALFTQPAKILPAVIGLAAVIVALGYAAIEAGDDLPGIRFPYLPATFFLLALAYTGHSARWRAGWLNWAVPVAVSLGGIAANLSFRGDLNSAILVLLALAYVYAIAARPAARFGLADFLRVFAAVQAVAAVAADFHGAGTQAIVLLAATGVGLVLTFDTRQPLWLLVAGVLFSDAWYWLARAVVPPPPHPGGDTLALVMSPLPVIYAAIGVGLRTWLAPARRRAWALPLYALAATVALLAIAAAASATTATVFDRRGTTTGDPLVGWLLLGYALLTYAVGVAEGEPVVVPIAGGGVTIGVTIILSLLNYSAATYPLALTGVALLTYGAQQGWRASGEEASLWVQMHRWTGLAIGALTVIYGFLLPGLSEAQSVAVISTMAAIVVLSAMVYVDGQTGGLIHADLIALLILSLLGGRLATYVGATNPQFYVVALGVALVLAGHLLLVRDRGQLMLAQLGVGLGALVLMGTSFAQTLSISGNASLYTALLLGEAVAAIAIGVSWRSRVLVVAGGAGAALAALRALFQALQVIPLFAIFGGVAIVVLVVAAALALARERLAGMTTGVRGSWHEWD